MKFGPTPLDEAEGAILAHSVTAGGFRLRKGHRISAADIVSLRAAGVAELVAAVLEPGDLGENEAATRLAGALDARGVSVKPASTGRVNIHAEAAGVLMVDRGLIDAINAVDPAITIATLDEYAAVEAGQMVATVKIIPFAVAGNLVEAAIRACAGRSAFVVNPYRALRVGLVQTVLPGVKPSVLDKTVNVTEGRLERSGSRLVAERRTEHHAETIAASIAELAEASDLVVVFGASAVSDEEDAIPAAIRLAGGKVERTGMPVDPGNLLVLGRLGEMPVIGAPGCARSPKPNGFDWVLDRILADVPITDRDIAGMGVGGLLMEIPTRPQPREARPRPAVLEIHGILLAAGRSSRMGGPNKLLAAFHGVPLVRHVADRLTSSQLHGVHAVVGHQAERVRGALAGSGAVVVENAQFASGLASSLQAGFRDLPKEADGVLVALADMPEIFSADIDRMIDAFRRTGGNSVIRATHEGRRGNPVILPRALFGEIARLEGDIGARHIVESSDLPIVDVEIGPAASVDVDTPEAMAMAGGVLQG
ncbi:molybdopterin-binding/glycosyltransferase family 2 protein [Aquamicrobium sp. LC103]|uniref:NTP transferase domain-containing protein n=1 Tax=Aquamicrobium sp. LC103 TaxID=1120658 RepID=UPI00063ECE9F|nr:molybdopterin-binding/glycosyltransferase family 2 protein [Aquamicrobium sp. LC103]TKT76924.1 4-diphosphocytidyl-2C-methyl-D-erythritol kinase [Aquamicrobium sp. LC103]